MLFYIYKQISRLQHKYLQFKKNQALEVFILELDKSILKKKIETLTN